MVPTTADGCSSALSRGLKEVFLLSHPIPLLTELFPECPISHKHRFFPRDYGLTPLNVLLIPPPPDPQSFLPNCVRVALFPAAVLNWNECLLFELVTFHVVPVRWRFFFSFQMFSSGLQQKPDSIPPLDCTTIPLVGGLVGGVGGGCCVFLGGGGWWWGGGGGFFVLGGGGGGVGGVVFWGGGGGGGLGGGVQKNKNKFFCFFFFFLLWGGGGGWGLVVLGGGGGGVGGFFG